MARLAEGAAVIYNCVNPPYHRWPADWPPIAASVLGAAERSGAVLVTLSNLYGYGPAARSLGVSAIRRGTSDDRGDAAGGDGTQGTGPRAASGRMRSPPTRPGGSGSPRSAPPISSGPARRARWVSGSSGGSARARASRCSAAPTDRIPGRSPRTWPGCWWWRAPTPGRGDAPGTCRRTSRSPSARSSPTLPAAAGSGSGARPRDPLGGAARDGTRLAAHAGAARDRVPVPRRLHHGFLGRPGDLRPEADALGGGRRGDGPAG